MVSIILSPVSSQAKDGRPEAYRNGLVSHQKVGRLIRLAQPRIPPRTRSGWARDVIWSLNHHGIKRNKENVCAMIAVIDQESNFKANPPVAGLGRKVIKTVHAKLDSLPFIGHYGKTFLNSYPSEKRSYRDMLRNARTERDLDQTYRKLVHNSLGSFKKMPWLKNILEHHNEIDTIGSMQVSVAFAVNHEEQGLKRPLRLAEIDSVRDWMYSRRGGIYYGAKQLLDYQTDYRRKIFRFADYNAGRYASRNAGFQFMINQISGSNLALDGDLLRYNRHRKAVWTASHTERALRRIARHYRLGGLNPVSLRSDLRKEKLYRFVRTKTYRKISRLYRTLKRRRPVKARLPEIRLKSSKLSRGFTTKLFARKVNHRYQTCIKRIIRRTDRYRSATRIRPNSRTARKLSSVKNKRRTAYKRTKRYSKWLTE